jgi:hypothetical protein
LNRKPLEDGGPCLLIAPLGEWPPLRQWGELGKIGSNINQIAYHLNAGRPGDVMEGSIAASLRELDEWRTALMQAIGVQSAAGRRRIGP